MVTDQRAAWPRLPRTWQLCLVYVNCFPAPRCNSTFIKDPHLYNQSLEKFGLVNIAGTLFSLVCHDVAPGDLTQCCTLESEACMHNASTCSHSLWLDGSCKCNFTDSFQSRVAGQPQISSLALLQGRRETLCGAATQIGWWQFNGLPARSTTPSSLHIWDPAPIPARDVRCLNLLCKALWDC